MVTRTTSKAKAPVGRVAAKSSEPAAGGPLASPIDTDGRFSGIPTQITDVLAPVIDADGRASSTITSA